MADRLTHEIGNAMVPLSTHQQLLAEKWKDAEFRASLNVALAEGGQARHPPGQSDAVSWPATR